ncbi:unnamed protein product [Adineta steineri]|uniref:G-protein coupled receptors family 1 profile domain-containing protein n=1 Tax=Adineta steineri TaxID=433720 RepID=A0A814ZBL9_9BILA|nr:unnamed protein product [Adineta steineri]CAF1241648.1 unnamed protein product [Adineta steineri]CAF3633686.1 unnamed protein product [Adineta steineri]CAF3947267.1 unnamed protein product [Adineta steineri]
MSEIGILNIIQLILVTFTILLALIYSIPIIFIRRFHTVNNIITANLSFAIICCAVYWTLILIVGFFYPVLYNGKVCIIFNYLQMVSNLQVSLAIVGASVNRLCSIVYHTKPFLRTKKWAIISIATQWAVGIILSLLNLPFNDSSCDQQLWKKIYKYVMVVIIPSIICLVNNMMIFKYVRSSTNRIQTSLEDAKNNAHQRQHLSRRDLHLLRHMIVMFCIFVAGWSPAYLYTVFTNLPSFTSIIVSMFILLSELSLLAVISDLFLYNHELRRYFREKIFHRH